MPVVNTKSSSVTAYDTSRQSNVSQKIDGGRLREKVATIEAISTDSIASVYRFFRVQSSDRVSRLMLCNDAITSMTADFGLYQTALNGGAVVDVDFFASVVSLATAALVNTDITHEAAVAAGATQNGEIANVEKRIWEVLGLTADPSISYDLCATAVAAPTANGTISLKLQYSDGN